MKSKSKRTFLIRRTILSFMLPTLGYMALFVVFPLVFSLVTSLRTWVISRPDMGRGFIGLLNYWKILTDPYFYESLGVTLVLSCSFVILEFFIGLLLALLMEKLPAIETFFTSLFILPTLMTPVVIALQWRFMLDADYGIVNWVLNELGLISKNITWLSTFPEVWFSIIVVDIWHWTPLLYLILLAGLRSLSTEPIEAARIDGANGFQILWRVILPMLRPIIAIGILIRFITAFIFFDEIYILTQGGPGAKTEVLSWFIYKIGFRFYNMGKAASASWIFLIIVELLCLFFLRIVSEGRREREYVVEAAR